MTISNPAGLGLLFAFLAYGLFSAYVMPRFFARMVEVIPMNTEVPWAVLLSPTSGNITQPAYLTAQAVEAKVQPTSTRAVCRVSFIVCASFCRCIQFLQNTIPEPSAVGMEHSKGI